MKRLILTTAMAAMMAGAPIAAAWAVDGNRGRGHSEQRGPGARGERPDRRGGERRFERPQPPPMRDDRRFERPEPPRMRDDRRFEAPRQLRPGGRLPGAYRQDRVEDYGRYRLRPPPQGYAWYRVGHGFMLVSPDGQIFDVID